MSSDDIKKRSRGIVFSASDTILLVDLVFKYKNILENKKTDAVTSKEKEKVWGLLANEFNSGSGLVPRSANTLKTKYENLKRTCRKTLAEEKCEVFKTGGGTHVPKLDPILEKIRGILSISGEGLQNPYDSNAVFSPDSDTVSVTSPLINLGPGDVGLGLESYAPTSNQEYLVDFIDQDQEMPPLSAQEVLQDTRKSWAGWNPEMLKSPVSYALLTPKKKALLDSGHTLQLHCNVESSTSSTSSTMPAPYNEKMDEVSDQSLSAKPNIVRSRNKTTPEQPSRNRPTLKPASGRLTAASRASSKFITLAEQKINFLQTKEGDYADERKERKKREEELHQLNVESAQLDIKIKRARLRNIKIKNRVLMQHYKKAFGKHF